jgi:hypothetical protein
VDGLLSFWLLSTVFAIVGTALRGLIRPISWGTLAIATLLIAPGKLTETVNAVRSGEVRLSLPPPPPAVPTAANPTNNPVNNNPVNNNPVNSAAPVPLNPNATPSPSTITNTPSVPDSLAEKGWTVVDLTAEDALPTTGQTTPSTTANNPAPTSTTGGATRNTPTSNPPVSGLW